jgi:tetratricopeptide (TPR) repeat protein
LPRGLQLHPAGPHSQSLRAPVFKGEVNAQEYYGRFRMGTHWLRQQNDAGKNPVAGFAVDDTDFALQEAEARSLTNARKLASGPLNGPLDRDTRLEFALLSARSGNIERARQLSDAISQEFPLDTLTQNYSLPTIHAAIQLQQNDPAGAIETLRPALKYDLAYPNPFNSLYPAYLRGLAYLRMNNGRLATQEFEKLTDHPAIIGRFVTGSLARLQLGRAQAMGGDQVAARKSYQEFLLLWQKADPDVPIYRQAKDEYERLK